MSLRCLPRRAAGFLAAILATAAVAVPEYEVGGPLAGLKLPPNPRGGRGEVELYPGAVEHWRAYMMKYLPTRGFFDQQSQIKTFVIPNIPGCEGKPVEKFTPPIYQLGNDSTGAATGKFQPPVEVVRCAINNPVFKLDLGELEPGLYVVRVIAAVETAKLRRFREPLYLSARINDGLNGETSSYRLRINYVDDFYCVAPIYFHAPAKRRYQAEVSVDAGSKVDLLVHQFTLDDVLAGTVRQAIKTKRSLHSDEEIAALKAQPVDPRLKQTLDAIHLTTEQRLARDAAIWKRFPPLNAMIQAFESMWPGGVENGVADKTAAEIAAEFGEWTPVEVGTNGILSYEKPELWDQCLENKKLGLKYTYDDLLARKPLPDPFPYKDDGAGLYFPDPKNPATGRYFDPIALGLARGKRETYGKNLALLWLQTGNEDIARDAAIALIRFMYDFPVAGHDTQVAALMTVPGFNGRDTRFRQYIEDYSLTEYTRYLEVLIPYDLLFPYIKGNEALAQSVSRFIPWVKTSDDLIQLLDVYCVQTLAKRIMRYHYFTFPLGIAQAATALADTRVTDPWMDWLFARTFVYPLAPAGVPDLLVSGHDQEGAQYIGSTYYSHGEGGRRMAADLDPYLRAGGNPKFDLGDPSRYPKTLAHCEWQLGITIAGQDFCRIGDVCGPDKVPGATLAGELREASRQGWRWVKDPRSAWILANVCMRKDETDADWKKIEEAAATVKRAPWLDLRSRVLDNWFGALESGLPHDDYRFRRAAYVRAGVGSGHAHADTMDLQVVAHGLPMTVDGGQRSGYTKPNDRFSRIHNTVEVDARGDNEYGLSTLATIRSLSDAEGARYLLASAIPPPGAKLYERQVALIDVDEGKGSQPLTAEQQRPGTALPQGVTTANSYVFDVFRVSGGKLHSYCFHATVNDDFQWNAANVKPVQNVAEGPGGDNDAQYLSIFSMAGPSKEAGDCPANFEATWRCSRDGKVGSEQAMLGKSFSEAAPRKFTRLSLLGTDGMRALKADVVETAQSPVKYRFTDTMLQSRANDGKLESAFAAIIEPYAGERFLTSEKLLPIEANETDALRAVAVEVQLKNGRTDVCFADGRPEKARKVSGVECRVSGEFGFVSRDAQGLRQASLTGGTLLEAPGIRLVAAKREHTGKVLKVDYPKKTLVLDTPWPAASAGRPFEIGNGAHRTMITSSAITPEGAGCRVAVTRSADFYRAPITNVLPDEKRVDGALGLPPGRGDPTAMTLSNDSLTKTWKVVSTRGNDFTLDGPVTAADFAPSNRVRLWTYGVGDPVRLPTFASVRRLDGGGWEVQGDTDLEITLDGKVHKVSTADLAKGPFHLPAK